MVKIVAVIKPPITTMASGLDVSEPMPFDNAAGNKPIAAISAVITTGRTLLATPSFIAFSNVWVLNSCFFTFCRFFLKTEIG